MLVENVDLLYLCFEQNIQIQNIERFMQRQLQRNSQDESSFFDHSQRSIKFQENSYEESESRLRSLKNQIELSRSQLMEIIDAQTYETEAMGLNKKGMEMINEGQVAQAIILISQAQKILEYAANSGKQINRNVIISVLHNLACCHQQTWSLEKCSNYVEALIYNLNCEIKQITDNQNENRLIVIEEVVMNRQLAQYYLLYCAINSQLKRNDAALIAAKKGNYLLKNSSVVLAKLASKSRIGIDSTAIDVLNDLGRLKTSTQDLNVEEMIETANFFMYVWKNRCSFPNFQLKALAQKLKEFSIGNIMQIEPRGIQMFDKLVWNQLTYQKILQRVVIVSVSYFTMATELRLLAVRMSNGNKQKARQMSEFRQSQCYHLISIIMLLYYLPFDLLFIQHILTSFTAHYAISIEPRFSNNNPKTLFSIFLQNDEKDEVKRSTAFNSDRGHSRDPSRNSFEQARNSHLKLQSDVKASLKGQNLQQIKEMAKLNNYYYVRQQNPIRQKRKQIHLKSNRMSHHSSKKNLLKRACATSKQSAQKTPVGYSPSQLSPRKVKNFSKSLKSGVSSKNSSLHKFVSPSYAKKMSNVIDEYFTTENQTNNKKNKRQLMNSKSKRCKQNIQSKGLKLPSSSPTWKANNILNKQQITQKSKQKSQLKGLKSPGKLKSKLQQAKSKKKLSKLNNYQ